MSYSNPMHHADGARRPAESVASSMRYLLDRWNILDEEVKRRYPSMSDKERGRMVGDLMNHLLGITRD